MERKPTPWAVLCPTHKHVYLTHEEYDRQMSLPNRRWMCPLCGDVSDWDDDTYEASFGGPMPYFVKRRIEIEAIQFTGNFEEIEKFVGGDAEFRDGKLLVATRNGPVWASPGDWICRSVKGDFYPCSNDVFTETYERRDK